MLPSVTTVSMEACFTFKFRRLGGFFDGPFGGITRVGLMLKLCDCLLFGLDCRSKRGVNYDDSFYTAANTIYGSDGRFRFYTTAADFLGFYTTAADFLDSL